MDKIKVIQTGRIGYVSTSVYTGSTSSNISVAKPVSTPVSSKYKLGRYKVAASALNVRTGAGTNYPVKRTYKNEYLLTVIKKNNIFYKIIVDNIFFCVILRLTKTK